MENEILDLVNEKDEVIGTIDRKQVYDNNIHNVRVIGIFIIDAEGLILVQRRSPYRRYCPNGYDFSVAGHVLSGESYEEAAFREANEELGIQISDIKEFLYCGYPNKYGLAFFSKYYIARCPNKNLIRLNKDESSKIEFLSIEAINDKLTKNPDMFKSDYEPAFREFCKYIYQ